MWLLGYLGWLLGYPGWLLRCCYVVARVLGVALLNLTNRLVLWSKQVFSILES